VHGGELIEQLRVHQLQAWLIQLGTNAHRQDATRHEHGEGEQQVQCPDVLVVGCVDPAAPACGGVMLVVMGMIVMV
jgi:hypothetical protein